MSPFYQDMYALFRHDSQAEDFFNALPPYVQDQIRARYRSVDSLERLQSYAYSIQGSGTLKTAPQIFLPSPGLF